MNDGSPELTSNSTNYENSFFSFDVLDLEFDGILILPQSLSLDKIDTVFNLVTSAFVGVSLEFHRIEA